MLGTYCKREQGANPFAQPSLIPQQRAPRTRGAVSYTTYKVPCPTAPMRSPPSPPDGISPSHPCRTSPFASPWLLQYSSTWHGTQGRLSQSSGSAPLILKTSLKAVRNEHFKNILIKHFRRTCMMKERTQSLHALPCSRPDLGDICISPSGSQCGDIAGVRAVRAPAIPTALKNTGVQRQ